MNTTFALFLTAALFVAVKGYCHIINATDCETTYHHLHCGLSGFQVDCMVNQHCLCVHSRICLTSSDCGRLHVTSPDGSESYGCPANGEWGCHHADTGSHCGCFHRETIG